MTLEQRLLDFRGLDLLAGGDSAIHRSDARAKILVALVFLVCVMSFERHALAPLLPYFAFPIVFAAWAGLPGGLVARKAALVLPFALAVGLANPWFERHERGAHCRSSSSRRDGCRSPRSCSARCSPVPPPWCWSR